MEFFLFPYLNESFIYLFSLRKESLFLFLLAACLYSLLSMLFRFLKTPLKLHFRG